MLESLPLRLAWQPGQRMYVQPGHGQPLPEAHSFAWLRTGSGPLLDQVDIHAEVPRVEYEDLSDDRLEEPSAAIRGRVEVRRKRNTEITDMH
jgi:predicted ATPase with chaperone activity